MLRQPSFVQPISPMSLLTHLYQRSRLHNRHPSKGALQRPPAVSCKMFASGLISVQWEPHHTPWKHDGVSKITSLHQLSHFMKPVKSTCIMPSVGKEGLSSAHAEVLHPYSEKDVSVLFHPTYTFDLIVSVYLALLVLTEKTPTHFHLHFYFYCSCFPHTFLLHYLPFPSPFSFPLFLHLPYRLPIVAAHFCPILRKWLALLRFLFCLTSALPSTQRSSSLWTRNLYYKYWQGSFILLLLSHFAWRWRLRISKMSAMQPTFTQCHHQFHISIEWPWKPEIFNQFHWQGKKKIPRNISIS